MTLHAVAILEPKLKASTQQKHKQTQIRIMCLFSQNPEISTRQVFNRVGVSNGKAYYCISALVEKGLVKAQNFSKSSNKTSYLYHLTLRGVREKTLLTAKFLECKLQKFDDLKDEIKQLERDLVAEARMQSD